MNLCKDCTFFLRPHLGTIANAKCKAFIDSNSNDYITGSIVYLKCKDLRTSPYCTMYTEKVTLYEV